MPTSPPRDRPPLAPDRTPLPALLSAAKNASAHRPGTAFMPRRDGGVILTGCHPELGTARVELDAHGHVVTARYTPPDAAPPDPAPSADAARAASQPPPNGSRQAQLTLAATRLAICHICEHHQAHTRTTVKCALAPNPGPSGCRCTNLLTGTCPANHWP